MTDLIIKEALIKYSRYCACREVCATDLKKKILMDKKLQVTSSEVEKIIDQLIDEGFINEERFASAFVNDHFRFNKWGKIKIRYQLRSKGIQEDYIQTALNTIPASDYKELLKELALKKWDKLASEDDIHKKRMKCANYLSSRGFESDLIFSELEKL
ncbi:regulatory protein RecX [Mangrovivirga cuniculi]|uniref:Regulatory protein RecX n=1 Tax=Mangrovivirga cuniculi TaxID=2715131 RepID=A0A4D7JXJ1_9BACT|nr:regulatory protein RecX [Mangrovivirga cuniculi]QCK13434.1 RecX family transcriptional regulator [Mangrovivirga cuniculi]